MVLARGTGWRGLGAAVLAAALVPSARAEEPVPPDRPSYNLFGVTGLIDTPSADMQPDGELSATASYFGGFSRITLTSQILPGVEASFRYAALQDLLAGPGETTLYDRSFDLKVRLVQEAPFWPSVVIGLQDFLGTGVYSGEYFAATKHFLDGDLVVTGGVGWGRFAGLNGINNPVAQVADRFRDRTGSSGLGGDVRFGEYFSGPEIGFFGGLEWHTPIEGLRLKLEYSSDIYQRETDASDFAQNAPFNAGIEYNITRGIEVGAYYMYGTEFGLRLSVSGNPFRPLALDDNETGPQVLIPRAAPGPDPALGALITGLVAGPSTAIGPDKLADVTVTERGGVRWAVANLPPSADSGCPEGLATGIDAEWGVVDVVTFQDAKGPVCTVALRPAGQAAIRAETRARTRYPTDWFSDSVLKTNVLAELTEALDADAIGLFGIELGPERVTVYIENAKFRAMPRAIGRTARALARSLPDSVETFEIVPIEASLPVVSVTLDRASLEDQVERPDADRAAWLSARIADARPVSWGGVPETLDQFPRYTWAINPALPVNLFDPDQPIRVDLSAEVQAGVEFLPGLSLNGAVQKRIVGDLDQIERDGNSVLEPVRSNIADYLREGDPAITRLTGDYLTKLDDSLYARVSVGLLERMFGGLSAELLWKPANQSWGLGAEINLVQQRDFNQLFRFQDYEVITGHASFYWDTGFYGLSTQIDLGRYLAGDYGGTVTISRRFDNGWEIGGFFTLTDVPFDEFGEGSFDKGLFVTIPLNWALPLETRTEFTSVLRPLTRDGGARLEVANRLYPIVQDQDRSGLRADWGSFWE